MPKDIRIVFMGTPEFAVPSLEALLQDGHQVVAVVTAPDKPAGRGLQLKASAVKECALAHHLPVLQPTNLKDPEFLSTLLSYEANLQVVVAFRMLPESIWSYPAEGTFNLHASLLPNYRGAAPINWAIMNGETETGCTTFFLKHEIDTGNILFQEKEPIYAEDTVAQLYERLMHKGAQLVCKTVRAIRDEKISPIPQDETLARHAAPKIHKETCRIDWNKSAQAINNFVRGLSPIPAAWSLANDKQFKIYKTSVSGRIHAASGCGQVVSDGKKFLDVATGDGFLSIEEMQPEGKKRMSVEEFLRGYQTAGLQFN
jgi:methionyl-tRNA formyltransferase